MHKCHVCGECFRSMKCPQCGSGIRDDPNYQPLWVAASRCPMMCGRSYNEEGRLVLMEADTLGSAIAKLKALGCHIHQSISDDAILCRISISCVSHLKERSLTPRPPAVNSLSEYSAVKRMVLPVMRDYDNIF